ncbi:NADPH:quinone oxidoreductase family protein, partial [Kitasatospora cineracea]
RPLVSARLPLESAATAVHDLAAGTTTGRLTLLP